MKVDFKPRILYLAVLSAVLAMLAAGACAQAEPAPATLANTDESTVIAVGTGPAGIASGPDGLPRLRCSRSAGTCS